MEQRSYFPANATECSLVSFNPYCNAGATQAITGAYLQQTRQDAARVFAWAQAVYPSLFAGTAANGVFGAYYFSYFPGSDIYIGVEEATGEVYVHNGRNFNFFDAGSLRTYLDMAGRAGYRRVGRSAWHW